MKISHDDALFGRIIRLMRWVELASILATLAIAANVRTRNVTTQTLVDHGASIIGWCAAMAVYNLVMVAAGREEWLSRSTVPGITIDLLFITAILVQSDGLQSFFLGLYYLVAMGAAVWFGTRGALFTAVAASLLAFGSEMVEALLSPGSGTLAHHERLAVPDVFSRLPYQFLVAWLAGAIVEAFRREGERRVEVERSAAILRLDSERVAADLRAARQVQENLLPAGVPDVPGLEVAARYHPAGEVGGDAYDFFPHSPPETGFMLADVSGHSLPAALLVSSARTALRDVLGLPPAAAMASVNRRLLRDTGPDRFVTMIYARIDPGLPRVSWVNAGHPPPILLRPGSLPATLEGHGLILGVVAGVTYESYSRDLVPGDVLLLYSDGLMERRNADGGVADLPALLNALQSISLAADIEAVADAILDASTLLGESEDDVTLVVIRVTGPGA